MDRPIKILFFQMIKYRKLKGSDILSNIVCQPLWLYIVTTLAKINLHILRAE